MTKEKGPDPSSNRPFAGPLSSSPNGDNRTDGLVRWNEWRRRFIYALPDLIASMASADNVLMSRMPTIGRRQNPLSMAESSCSNLDQQIILARLWHRHIADVVLLFVLRMLSDGRDNFQFHSTHLNKLNGFHGGVIRDGRTLQAV
jgi:hypothetical protein